VESYFSVLLALATSVGLLLVGRRRLQLSVHGLRTAAGLVLAWLGMAAAVFAGNVLVGMAVALLVRSLTTLFVPLYLANDIVLLALSALQALLLLLWWTTRPDSSAD
jgi:hypothetical protein